MLLWNHQTNFNQIATKRCLLYSFFNSSPHPPLQKKNLLQGVIYFLILHRNILAKMCANKMIEHCTLKIYNLKSKWSISGIREKPCLQLGKGMSDTAAQVNNLAYWPLVQHPPPHKRDNAHWNIVGKGFSCSLVIFLRKQGEECCFLY